MVAVDIDLRGVGGRGEMRGERVGRSRGGARRWECGRAVGVRASGGWERGVRWRGDGVSRLALAKAARPLSSIASALYAGATMRQGPHEGE